MNEGGCGVRVIENLQTLASLKSQEVAVSEWLTVDQERIDEFAQATGDRQWIHVDVERARRESPFGGTVAHGFLTLSLLPYLSERALRIEGLRLTVNCGLNRVRIPAPLPAGSRIRARFTLLAADPIEGGLEAQWRASFEREGGQKPVCVAESVARYYPGPGNAEIS
jgi:acyl dehydratase